MARSTQLQARSVEESSGSEQRTSVSQTKSLDSGSSKAEVDTEVLRKCANFPGTSRARWNKWPVLANVGDFDSPLSTQMCIQQQVRQNPHDIDSVVNAPKNFDENSWKYEYIRQFCGELNVYVARLAASTECTDKICPTMQAGTWQYLIALYNGSTRECTATEYVMVTLDQAARQLNNTANFPSRVNIKPERLAKLNSLCRRLYRVFSHAFYHHRSFFNAMESETSLCRRFTRFVAVYKFMASDTLIVPIIGENVTSEEEADAMEKQNTGGANTSISNTTTAVSNITPESLQKRTEGGAEGAHADTTHTTSMKEGKGNKSKVASSNSQPSASSMKPVAVNRSESNSSVKQQPASAVAVVAADVGSDTSSSEAVPQKVAASASKAITGSIIAPSQQSDPAKRRLTYEPGSTRNNQSKSSSSQQQISATIKLASKKPGNASASGTNAAATTASSKQHSALKNQKSTPGSGSQEAKSSSGGDKTASSGGGSPTKVASFEKPVLYLRRDGDIPAATSDTNSKAGSDVNIDSGVGDSSSGSSGKNSPELSKIGSGREEDLNESEA